MSIIICMVYNMLPYNSSRVYGPSALLYSHDLCVARLSVSALIDRSDIIVLLGESL